MRGFYCFAWKNGLQGLWHWHNILHYLQREEDKFNYELSAGGIRVNNDNGFLELIISLGINGYYMGLELKSFPSGSLPVFVSNRYVLMVFFLVALWLLKRH